MRSKIVTGALTRLRRRERALTLIWGVARWISVVAACLVAVGAVDWWVERRYEMPGWLREVLAGAEIVVLIVTAFAWIIVPVFRRRTDDGLALFVESRRPGLTHCLISAVQLSRGGTRVAAMSPELIDAVITEAENQCTREDYTTLLDHRRIGWSGVLAAASVLLLTGMVATELGAALLARQFFADVEMPRRIRLEDLTVGVQPAGEPTQLRFAVRGDGPFDGEIRWRTEGEPEQRMAVNSPPVDGILSVALPLPHADFEFDAYIGDARLRRPGRVRLVPRPAVAELAATLLLPGYLGRQPDGSRHTRSQSSGDVTGILGCTASVAARVQKDIVKAEVETLGRPDAAATGPLPVVRCIAMQLTTPREARAAFDLQPGETAYRVAVYDSFGFRNLDPPRRDIHLLPEEPPIVTLLPEQFRPTGETGPAAEEFEVEGVPVPLGSALRVGYAAHHAYGLGRAFFVYRLTPGTPQYGPDGSPPDLSPRPIDGEWKRLPLVESPATPQTGAFDPRRGCFANSRANDQVQFHAASESGGVPRIDGGGRFDFQTRALPELRVGDQVEYFIEVTSAHPEKPLAGRSETRVKRIVTVAELVAWIDGALRQEDRIRRLAERQRSVFDAEKKPEPR